MLWLAPRWRVLGWLGMPRVSSTTRFAEEAGPPRPAQGRMASDQSVPLFAAAPLGAVALSSGHRARTAGRNRLEKFLGRAVTSADYTGQPTVRSDGVMRIFDVDTPYGRFAFDGV